MFARVKELNRIEDIPKTKGRLCGGLLKKGDKGTFCPIQPTDATIA